MDTELPEIYDFLLKFIIIGNSGVGKSCLMHHFLNNRFRNPSPHTIGVEFSSTLLRLPSSTPTSIGSRLNASKTLKVQLWDTAGQERFRSVTRNYYRGACGCIVVYDITNRASFNSLTAWIADARALASPDLEVVLVGNKLDEEDSREVTFLEASLWAKENNVIFVETSSLSGENVEQPFILLARAILLAIESGRLDPEKAGSGVSYGERTLRRVSSWGSGGQRKGFRIPRVIGGSGGNGKCC